MRFKQEPLVVWQFSYLEHVLPLLRIGVGAANLDERLLLLRLGLVTTAAAAIVEALLEARVHGQHADADQRQDCGHHAQARGGVAGSCQAAEGRRFSELSLTTNGMSQSNESHAHRWRPLG